MSRWRPQAACLARAFSGFPRAICRPVSSGRSPNCAFQSPGGAVSAPFGPRNARSQSGYDEIAACGAIPYGLDLLITHGPAGDGALGRASASLAQRMATVEPRAHVFGHYHLGRALKGPQKKPAEAMGFQEIRPRRRGKQPRSRRFARSSPCDVKVSSPARCFP